MEVEKEGNEGSEVERLEYGSREREMGREKKGEGKK